MKREMIINELKAKGYVVEVIDVVKNGIEHHGIIMGNGSIRPTVYVDEYLEWSDDMLHIAVNNVIWAYENANKKSLRFSRDNLLDWNFVKDKLQLCLQKKGTEDIVKRDFLDLEKYVRVIIDTNENVGIASFKVKPEHLIMFGVTEDVLFNAAWDCTKPTLIKEDMIEIMAKITHMAEEEIFDTMGDTPMQIVLSNINKTNGAIAMYGTWLLGEIADRYESDLVILPSSIHEVIVMPVDEKIRFDELNDMVREINSTEVSPEERLGDHAYRFNRDTREITYYTRN